MKLSIIVPAYNEAALLPRTLRSIRVAAKRFDKFEWDYEVIVCDNNSTDRTADIARELGAQVIFEPINQIARARNTGASVARGEWLMFLDADCDPSGELFAEAAALASSGKIVFAGALVQLDAQVPKLEAALVGSWNLLSRAFKWMAGSFILVEASAFREVGGFDSTLYAGEELELSRRLKSVARRRRKRGTIITRFSLKTSARRMILYSRIEMLRFCLQAILRPRATSMSRDACSMWYDGRR